MSRQHVRVKSSSCSNVENLEITYIVNEHNDDLGKKGKGKERATIVKGGVLS